MTFLDWVAAVVLFLHLPVPLFWLVVHPLVGFWRTRQRAAFVGAGLVAWGTVLVLLWGLHAHLFDSAEAPLVNVITGLALFLADAMLVFRAEQTMGLRRLVGKAELEGAGELATTGIYARIRHPRYAGMMLSVLGACLLAATLLLWVICAVWLLLVVFVIHVEERELRRRFGSAYDEYCRRVPALLPFRVFPRQG